MKFSQLKSANDINEVSSLMHDISELIRQYSHIHHVKEVADIKELVEKLGNKASEVIDEFYRTR